MFKRARRSRLFAADAILQICNWDFSSVNDSRSCAPRKASFSVRISAKAKCTPSFEWGIQDRRRKEGGTGSVVLLSLVFEVVCEPLGRDPSASPSDVDRGGRNGFSLVVEGEMYFHVVLSEILEEGVDEDRDANHFQDLFGRHQELVRERRISVHR